MDLRLQVKQYIREKQLIRPEDHVIVGLSGGADSVCLLLVLKSLRGVLDFTLSAVHVHHGIRGAEADRDAAFCSALCRREEIPFRLLHCDVPAAARDRKRSLEETARDLRYLRFREARREYEFLHPGVRVRVAVAHHMDDQAETVLMNLCRGTGLRGLCGMPAERDGIIRPLLGCRRQAVEDWLRGRGVSWITDSTNQSDDYTRNRIRHEFLPELCHINSRSVEHLAHIAGQAGEWDAYLQAEAERWLKQQEDRRSLPAEALASLPQALRGRILQMAAADLAGGSRNIGSRHIQALDGLLSSGVGARVQLPGGWIVRRDYSTLCFLPAEEEEEAEENLVRADFSVFPRRKNQKIPQKQYTKWFDYDKITEPLCFRTRRTGDELLLAGVGTKSVQRYMIDARIPERERDRIPLLAAGSQILWIVGYRMNAAYQVTEETQTILQVTVHPRDGAAAGDEDGRPEEHTRD